MRAIYADSTWNDLVSAVPDRPRGVPFIGFVSGSLISLGLWALITWFAVSLFV